MKRTLFASLVLALFLVGCSSPGGIPQEVDEHGHSGEESHVPDRGKDLLPHGNYPVMLSTMTHLEGDWHMAATNEDFFNIQAEKLRYGMDLAEEYDAILTLETETPFAEGMVNFGDNVFLEAMQRGHGVGTHCDTSPQSKFTDEEMVEEASKRKVLVDNLVGAENNLGCSGLGGWGDWYVGATGAGFDYINGIVGFHYMAMPRQTWPEGWDIQSILAEYFHYPAPVEEEKYFYPFLVSEVGFEEDVDGDLLVSAGSIGALDTMHERGDWNAYGAECGHDCPFTQEDVDGVVSFLEAFIANHDGSRPGKVVFYFPSSTFVEENEEVLHTFFAAMQQMTEDPDVIWASQTDVYDMMMKYYGR